MEGLKPSCFEAGTTLRCDSADKSWFCFLECNFPCFENLDYKSYFQKILKAVFLFSVKDFFCIIYLVTLAKYLHHPMNVLYREVAKKVVPALGIL